MNRRMFFGRFGKYAMALPFVGAAAGSPKAQILESEAMPLISYGPLGRHTAEYGLWINHSQIARGPARAIVERAQTLIRAIYGR